MAESLQCLPPYPVIHATVSQANPTLHANLLTDVYRALTSGLIDVPL